MIWQLEEFHFDENNQTLISPEGKQILEPKVAALLAYFCHHPKRDITRDELLKAVWHQHLVSDNAINRVILLLRKALKDDDKIKRFIITKPKVGYRFIADINHTKPVLNQQQNKASVVRLNSKQITKLLLTVMLLIALALWLFKPKTNHLISTAHTSPLVRVAGEQSNASLSPDGNRLVYTATSNQQDQSNQGIFLLNQDNPIPLKISSENGHAQYAKWSYRGDFLVYLFNNKNSCEFHRVDLIEGIAQTPQTIHQCDQMSFTRFAFSEDDSKLYFIEQKHPLAPYQAFELNLNTQSKRLLSQPLARGLGNHYLDYDIQNGLLLLSDQQPGITSAYVLTPDSNTHELLKVFKYALNTAIWGHRPNTIIHPSIHPAYELIETDLTTDSSTTILADSRRVSYPQKVTSSTNQDYLFTSYIYNRDIAIDDYPNLSINSNVMDYLPALSHNAKQLAYISKRTGDSQIWLLSLESGQLSTIEPTVLGRMYYSLSWSFDDKMLLANTQRGLLIIDLATNQVVDVLDATLPVFAANWYDDAQIAYSQYINDQWHLKIYDYQKQQIKSLDERWAMVLSNDQQRLFFDQELIPHRNNQAIAASSQCGWTLRRYALSYELDAMDFYCRAQDKASDLLKIGPDNSITRLPNQVMLGESYSVSNQSLVKTTVNSSHSDIMRTNFKQ